VYLVDANRQPVPIGLPGELLIGGVGLSRGYLNRPELTAETFIPHPFSEKSGARLYKTGDLARYLSDGNLEFLGRLDQQVKIHGHRIELEEIEVALRQHPAVREAVVVTQEDAHDGNKRLVAYWVADQESPPSPQDVRRFLQQKLPGYMIPSAFVVLDLLPLNLHGKVDRKALPAPDMRRLPFATAYVAPRTPAESKLASIWTDVLGVEQVGIHDNFFALGGDSILSIHIVARANQIGLRLTPKQLFQHQTIGELATVAGRIPNIQAEQGSVTGPVPLTPIQNWFFEQDFPEPHHWNQARLLQAQQALNISVLENVMQHLLAHHDMLRVRFTKGTSGWQQYIADAEQAPLCKRVDVSALSETQQDRSIEVASVELQTGLKLAAGPLVRVALFDYGSDQPARLLIVIHHLVVDSVSWHILLEDLQLAYQQLSSGRAIQLPPKTTAFKKWAEELTVCASSVALQQELSYWRAALHNPVSRLPVDNPKGANSMASTQRVSGLIGHEETQALLKDIPSAYQTQITDILLTALVRAFARWTGTPSLLIDLESHGREEDIVEGIDLSRTVGWFAARFPVLLQLKPGAPLIDTLKMVKEQLRGIPHRGIGYGLLRYLSQNSDTTELLKGLPQAEVCFNYIGHLDQVLPDSALFSLALESSGPSRSRRGNRHYLLEINSYIAAGQLHVDWRYSELMHRRTTIEELARGFLEDLRTLRTHCQTPGLSGYTPSDFPSMRLSQQELDELLSALDEPAEGD
jgi:non-ribosomal peptide synthase protein (TIGR01720 family)